MEQLLAFGHTFSSMEADVQFGIAFNYDLCDTLNCIKKVCIEKNGLSNDEASACLGFVIERWAKYFSASRSCAILIGRA